MKEVIDRFTYKRIKKYDRLQMNRWVNEFGQEMYNIGCRDCAAAEIASLRDNFQDGTQRIAKFMARRDEIINLINEREFSVEEVLNELRKEGLRIKTDFEPEVVETKGVKDDDKQ